MTNNPETIRRMCEVLKALGAGMEITFPYPGHDDKPVVMRNSVVNFKDAHDFIIGWSVMTLFSFCDGLSDTEWETVANDIQAFMIKENEG
jgi:hypothetical protein